LILPQVISALVFPNVSARFPTVRLHLLIRLVQVHHQWTFKPDGKEVECVPAPTEESNLILVRLGTGCGSKRFDGLDTYQEKQPLLLVQHGKKPERICDPGHRRLQCRKSCCNISRCTDRLLELVVISSIARLGICHLSWSFGWN
jgi:hypothetical protein